MKRAIPVAGLLVPTVPQFALAQNQQFVGAWKVDVAKSKYEPGAAREVVRRPTCSGTHGAWAE